MNRRGSERKLDAFPLSGLVSTTLGLNAALIISATKWNNIEDQSTFSWATVERYTHDEIIDH